MKVLLITHKSNIIISDVASSINASKVFGDIDILLIGFNNEEILKKLKNFKNINKILNCDDKNLEHDIAENIVPLIKELADNYDYFIAPANNFSKNLLPRLASILDISPIFDIIEIIDKKTFKHPIYAGTVIETIKSNQNKNILTIRTSVFENEEKIENKNVLVEKIKYKNKRIINTHISTYIEKSERPILTQAKIVIAGGKALGSKENFEKILFPLAEKLNAAIGATRAAVDADFINNEYQVGQTGKIISPDLYIAIGISGAIQHLSGIKDSKIIVAINKDPDAPIFKVAKYGIVADLFDVIPKLTNLL